MNNDVYFEKALKFIQGLGIKVVFSTLSDEQCFLPGLLIENGLILIDRDRMLYPGDVLHEAAHISLTPAAERNCINGTEIGKRKDAPAEEMAAIAWSYAAWK